MHFSPFKPLLSALLLSFSLGSAMLVTLPNKAEAFCGFYVGGAGAKLFNNATTVVMMREGKRTVLSMQNNYQGPPSNFAMVIPVPVVLQKENVKILPEKVFNKVDQMAAPRLVEYWEQDPCFVPDMDEMEEAAQSVVGPSTTGSSLRFRKKGEAVKIEAQFEVGEYDIVVLNSKDSSALDTWLRQNKYNIPDGAGPVLKPYVEGGMYFFVAKVNADKVKFGPNNQAQLSPLRFHYDSKEFSLPVRLGLLNANGAQDLIVHILARNQRYEMANFKNVTIPTNIEVSTDIKKNFAPFYTTLFDQTLAQNKGAVITEYSWNASTCDPCPGPTLDGSDFLTLGADSLPDKNPYGFVLTRLHARYTKDDLSQDLVFKAAPPIVGGRAFNNKDGQLEQGASPGPRNNFQGRYIMRHPWTGKVTCQDPVWGRWGGPPNGYSSGVQAVQNTAFAPRNAVQLTSAVRQDIPEIGVKAKTKLKDILDARMKKGASSEPGKPSTQDLAQSAPETTPKKKSSGGCAVVSTSSGSPYIPAFLGLALFVLGSIARRRTR